MAIVPRSTPTVPKISSLPNARNTTQVQAPNGIAAAVDAAIGGAMDVVQQRADRADTAAVMDAQRQLSEWQNNWFDPNNQGGVRAYQGVNALKLQDAMVLDFDKRAADITSRLPSARARQKFKEYAGVELQQVRSRINTYAVGETDAAETAMQNAFVETRKSDMIGAVLDGDASRAATTWETTKELIHANAAATGRPPEETALQLVRLKSDIHAGVLDVLLSRDPQEAESYYRRNVNEISPAQQAMVERAIRPMLLDSTAEQGMRAIVYGGVMPDAVLGFDGPSDGKMPPKVPDAMRKVIEAAADSHGVPRAIALALAEQESGFNPKAVGPQTQQGKAGGLYQFLEGTAKAKGIDRFDAQQAANAAMEDLAREGKARGWDWAVAHHFAGPNESLHGPKTRAYVEEVRAKARRYAGNQVGRRVAPAANKAEALASVQRIPDPQLRRAMEARVRDEFDVLDARQKAVEQQAAEEIYQKVADADPNTPLRQLLTPAEIAYVSRESSLSEAINRFRKLMATGQVIEDDPVVVDRLARLQASDPNAFRAVHLAEYADRLSGKTLLALTKDQKAAADPAKHAEWASDADRVESGLRQLGYQAERGKPEKNEAERARFRLFYQQAKAAFVQKQDRDLTPTESDALLRDVVRRVAARPDLLRQAEVAEKYAGNITEADRMTVIQVLRQRGVANPTEAQIVAAAGAYYSTESRNSD